MYLRKPLPYGEQLARLNTYLRRARSDLRRKYDDFFEATKARRDFMMGTINWLGVFVSPLFGVAAHLKKVAQR